MESMELCEVETIGSGALPGLMLDLGLLKINVLDIFFKFLAPTGHNPNPLINLT